MRSKSQNSTLNFLNLNDFKRPNENLENILRDNSVSLIANKSTGGPPLTWFSLPRIPLRRFLAYVCTSGGFFHYYGTPYSPTNANFASPKIHIRRGPSVLFYCIIFQVLAGSSRWLCVVMPKIMMKQKVLQKLQCIWSLFNFSCQNCCNNSCHCMTFCFIIKTILLTWRDLCLLISGHISSRFLAMQWKLTVVIFHIFVF